MSDRGRVLVWLSLGLCLPVAFMPGGLSAFGPVKRDTFIVLAMILISQSVVRHRSDWRMVLRRVGRLPAGPPLAMWAVATGLGGVMSAAGGNDSSSWLEPSLAAAVALLLLAEDVPHLGAKILGAHVLGVILAGGYAAIQVAGLDPWPWQRLFAGGAPGSTYGNPLFLADGLVVSLPCVLAVMLAGPFWARTGALGAWIFLADTLLRTQARGAWVAGSAGIVCFVLWAAIRRPVVFNRARGWLAASMLAAVCCIGWRTHHPGLAAPVLSHAATVLTPGRDEFRGRRLMWEATAKMGICHPVLGWGPGQLAVHYTEYQALLLSDARFRDLPYRSSAHAHQDFLQFFSERGGVGLGLVIWVLVTVVRVGLHSRAVSAGAALSGVVALALDGLVNGPWHVPPSSLLVWIFMGIVVQTGRKADVTDCSPPISANVAGLTAAIVLAIIRPYARDLVGESYFHAGVFFLETHRPKAAVHMLMRTGVLLREDRRQHLYLGQSYFELGEFASAVGEFEEDVDANPWMASGWHNLGVAQMRLGDTERAKVSLRRALTCNPSDPEVGRLLDGLERHGGR